MPNRNQDDATWRIAASGLVSEDLIQAAVARLNARGLPLTESNLVDILREDGYLSRWQAMAIVRDGKYKGFIAQSYMFLKVYPLSKDGVRVAEALDCRTQEFVLLRIIQSQESFAIETIMPLSADSSGEFPVLSADARLQRANTVSEETGSI